MPVRGRATTVSHGVVDLGPRLVGRDHGTDPIFALEADQPPGKRGHSDPVRWGPDRHDLAQVHAGA